MKRTQFLLILDTILFVSLVVSLEPRFEGLALHEWLGLALVPLIATHILCGWQWIATTVVRLGAKGAWRLRANALLNTLLFVAFVITVFSGAMTSFIALPALGIPPGNFEGWRHLHNQWEIVLEILAGLHVALNWGWIVNTIRKHVLLRPAAPVPLRVSPIAAEPPDS